MHEQHSEYGGKRKPDRRVALPRLPQCDEGPGEPGQVGGETDDSELGGDG
jgi:hypothetical protein